MRLCVDAETVSQMALHQQAVMPAADPLLIHLLAARLLRNLRTLQVMVLVAGISGIEASQLLQRVRFMFTSAGGFLRKL